MPIRPAGLVWVRMTGMPKTLVAHNDAMGVWVRLFGGVDTFIEQQRIKSWDDTGKVLIAW